MKSAFVLLLLSIVAGASGAAAAERNPTYLFDPGNHVDEAGLVRSRDGRPIGRIEADVDGIRVLRDTDGRRIGNVVRGFNENELVIRDSDGRRQGTLERR
ncbi:hypothetical protein [Azospirillum canadense]|uniref:hypothetical protein n=1 Tax=Azospirillum canadense TaxID=403962 RepID=UPI0022274F11|nr:hypothetical protein [Azospirillum canadense]MCW2239138.1 hypothetical protein [Azospirillum canadense]